MDRNEKTRRLEQLRAEVLKLETELLESSPAHWPPRDYYTSYHILAGMVLGFIGACSSLLFNLIGSAVFDQSPFELIRVYMTFPLGERALVINDGFALAGGCGLYLITGAFFGIPFHMILSRWFPGAPAFHRLAVVTALGLALWLINYYALLSWIQPLLLDGRWILERIPWWVAVLTHLCFAWTMLLVDRWGAFVPYRAHVPAEERT